MADRQLEVHLESVHVGTLQERAGIWSLVYEHDWLARADAFAIAPGLPLVDGPIVDEGTRRPVQWFFDNLLPEEALRERLAKERKIDAADAFSLLAAYGSESAGSLTLLSPGTSLPRGGRKPLSRAEITERIRGLPRSSLEARAPKKMSLAGAQHKLPVILESEEFFEPEGSEPSTHILKPDHRDADSYPHSAANEWFVMQLAGRLGLIVPTTTLYYCPEPVFVVERFDRLEEDGTTRRLHAIDACQLLNLDRTFKYESMSLEALLRIADATRSRALTRTRLFRWCAFNALVGNADAHLKNLSFLVSPAGIELAPHYDLLSTALFEVGDRPAQWGRVNLSIKIGAATRFRELSRESLLELAFGLRIRKDAASKTLDQMCKRMHEGADQLIVEFENREVPESAVAYRAGELRVLRQIRHVVINDTCKQVASR